MLVALGMPQNLGAYTEATTLEGAKQVIAQGPVASQIAIKQLGTNGGGFFNVNSAHPFENPSAITNFIEMWAILVISAALTYTFGKMVRDTRQGWALFAVMGVLFLGGLAIAYWAEASGNPAFQSARHRQQRLRAAGRRQHGRQGGALRHRQLDDLGDRDHRRLERLGQLHARQLHAARRLGRRCSTSSSARSSSAASGSGLYGMLLFAIIAVFIAGLMVGRTPEYLGKKIEAKEVKMSMLAILILPFSILGFTALAVVVEPGLAGMSNAGPHGFSEMLYAYSSGTGNNGSAFAGLTANTPFYNITIGLAMLIGRFIMIVPMMAVAGSLAAKKIVPAVGRHLPDRRRRVRRPAGRRDPDRRRPHLLPRARARADRRALLDERRNALLGRGQP